MIRLFGLPESTPAIEARYNIAPTTYVAAVREAEDTEPGTDAAATRRIAMLYWGLVPSWAKEKSIGVRMINARAETLRDKPAFRNAYLRRRALVPADGYYEWQRLGARDNQPYVIRPATGAPFAIAALWEWWRDPANGEPLESCTLITTAAAPSVEHIHDRMPLILPPSTHAEWLDPRNQDLDRLDRLLDPSVAGPMVARPVSRRVGDARNEGAELLEPEPGASSSLPVGLAPGETASLPLQLREGETAPLPLEPPRDKRDDPGR